ncbi:MAG: hypothetical protein HN347_15110 [Bacteroidetes bacterium]|jgi:hypothetical protein|nr:hypothetical protein [Bacteroidota bacterium]MBT7144058.1 hypothetical protein [Bacteroidota bacterium]
MKNVNLKLVLLFCFISIVVLNVLAKSDENFTKKFHEEFSADKNTKLLVENKYGYVSLKNWEKNSVMIDVTITVETSKEDKADDVFEKISISISQEGDVISAITKITEKIRNADFTIDYDIKIPTYLKLDVSNKFGDVFINETSGETKLNIEYGNLKANKLLFENTKPMSEIKLSYSNGDISKCTYAKIILKYSNLNMTDSKTLIIVSRYTNVDLETSKSVIIDSKYDGYDLGTCQNFVYEGKFTAIEIDEVSDKIDVDMQYGNCEINYVPIDFESINIENKYGGIEIGIDENASYKLNAELEYCEIDYPSEGDVQRKIDGSESEVHGFIGADNNTKSKVTVVSKYGNVELD